MDLNSRPIAPDPYELLPEVPTFTLTSNTMNDGETMPAAQTAPGGNTSPHLSWSGFPPETKSFVVSCFDPDAPTPAGYWHWTVVDIPAEVTELPEGAGQSDLQLEGAAAHIRIDSGDWAYYGANPPAGDRPHRYIFAVHALDVDSLEVDPEEVTATTVSFMTLFHTIARARLTVTFQQ